MHFIVNIKAKKLISGDWQHLTHASHRPPDIVVPQHFPPGRGWQETSTLCSIYIYTHWADNSYNVCQWGMTDGFFFRFWISIYQTLAPSNGNLICLGRWRGDQTALLEWATKKNVIHVLQGSHVFRLYRWWSTCILTISFCRSVAQWVQMEKNSLPTSYQVSTNTHMHIIVTARTAR